MSVTLKLDGRTKRGITWKEMNASGNPINQGIIVGGKCCSNCNQLPDVEKQVISCMKCNHSFHVHCLLVPITEANVKEFSENPSMWWFCLNCVATKSGDGLGAISTVLENTPVPSDVLLKTTLASFKKEMLMLVSETIDRKFNEPPNSSVKGKPPVKSAWNNAPPPCNKPAATNEPSTEEFKQNNSNKEKHILILDANDSTDITADNFNKSTVQNVSKAIEGINADFCKVKKSGVVTLGFNDKSSKEKAENKIKKYADISEKFSTRSPKKLLPKVTLSGINEIVFDSCDVQNKDEMKSTLLKDILSRNENVKEVIDSNPDETLEVMMILKSMPTNYEVSYTAVLKMSSKIRKIIHKSGNSLYVSLSRCRVTDRYHVLQCYHCQKPSHHSNDCPDKGKEPTCMYCSGKHKSKMCPDKSNKCCSNCLHSRNQTLQSNAYSHNAASLECPVMKPHRERIRDNTINWSGKN